MIKRKKILSLKEPERLLEQQIKNFIHDNEKAEGPNWEMACIMRDPVGFASD